MYLCVLEKMTTLRAWFYGLNRFERCLLCSSHCRGTPQILEILSAGQPIPIHVHAKWAFICPRCFTKLLKPAYSTLRQHGHLNIGYLDDSYLQGSDTTECLLNISGTQTLFTDLGQFVINVDQSCLIPAQRINFLGFVLDSVSMTITLTDDKKAKEKSICKQSITTQKSFYNYRARPVSGHACLLPTRSTIWPASLQEFRNRKELGPQKT